MSMSNIKTTRAAKIAAIGQCPASYAAMLDCIPRDVGAALTSTQLAHLVDAIWQACQESKRIACQDAIAEGVIWDQRKACLHVIGPKAA